MSVYLRLSIRIYLRLSVSAYRFASIYLRLFAFVYLFARVCLLHLSAGLRAFVCHCLCACLTRPVYRSVGMSVCGLSVCVRDCVSAHGYAAKLFCAVPTS